MAADWLDEDRPGKAVKLLEPLFDGDVRLDERHAMTFTVLCDALAHLGHKQKQHRLIMHVAQSDMPLSADAW